MRVCAVHRPAAGIHQFWKAVGHGHSAARTGRAAARAHRALPGLSRRHRLHGDPAGRLPPRGRRGGGLLALPALPGQRHRLARQPQRPRAHRRRRGHHQGPAQGDLPAGAEPARPSPTAALDGEGRAPARPHGPVLLLHARQRPPGEAGPHAGLRPQDPGRDDRPPVPGPVAARRSRPARPQALLLLDQSRRTPDHRPAAHHRADTDRADLRRPGAVRDHDAGRDGRKP